jgi:hypothetical protein
MGKRQVVAFCRVTRTEHRRIAAAAKVRGVSMSYFLRRVALLDCYHLRKAIREAEKLRFAKRACASARKGRAAVGVGR